MYMQEKKPDIKGTIPRDLSHQFFFMKHTGLGP
jgi:hypothetical protein